MGARRRVHPLAPQGLEEAGNPCTLRFEGHLEAPSILQLAAPVAFALIELARATDSAGTVALVAGGGFAFDR